MEWLGRQRSHDLNWRKGTIRCAAKCRHRLIGVRQGGGPSGNQNVVMVVIMVVILVVVVDRCVGAGTAAALAAVVVTKRGGVRVGFLVYGLFRVPGLCVHSRGEGMIPVGI